MKKALVIGDIMLDKYVETEPVRISDEAPVLIMRENEVSYILGGAGNTAANLKSMGFEVSLQGRIGDDEAGRKIQELLIVNNINPGYIIIDLSIKTTVKERIVCKGKQIVRIDSECKSSAVLPLTYEQFDVIVISDYAKGVIGENTVKILKDNYKCPIIVNGKPKNIRYYAGADILIFNKKEADEALECICNTYNPVPHYTDIVGLYALLYLIVTKGDKGIEAYNLDEVVYSADADKVEVKDITGAGDTVTAAIALEIANSGNVLKAIQLANKAGGIKVTKDKTATVSLEELNYNPDDENRPSSEEQKNNFDSERIDG